MTESRFDPEEEAFNEIERQAKQRKESVRASFAQSLVSGPLKDRENKMYESGWNSALEMAAFEIEHNFTKAFGKDTLQSIAMYIRTIKK